MLKALRRRRGMSLADAARALRELAARIGQPLPSSVASVQRTVSRWEAAKGPIRPGERYQLLLAHLYGRTPSGELAIGTGSDFAQLLTALAEFGETEARIRELRELMLTTATEDGGGLLALLAPSARATLAAAMATPARADETLISELQAAVAEVNAQVGSVPFVRLQLLLSPVIEACRRLLADSVPQPIERDLRAVAATAYTLAGRIAFETRDDVASRALYAAATQAAETLPTWRRAVIHMSHALTTLYATSGRTPDGLLSGLGPARALLDAAVRDARQGESVVVRARAHALQSEIAARAGQQRQAETALSLARYDLEKGSEGDPSPSSFSPSHLRGFEGLYELYVGDADKAHSRFGVSADALTAPRERVQQSIVRTDQAFARLRLGEPQAAASLLHNCIAGAGSAGGRVPLLRLRDAREQLRPWRREVFVIDLDEHFFNALST